MAGQVVFTFRDAAGQKSTVSFDTDDVTGANIATIQSLYGALTTALQGVTVGNINSRRFLAAVDTPAAGIPSDLMARREIKWELRLADSVTGDILYREVPTPDISTASALVIAGTEEADMSASEWVSLKSAIDGNYNNPATGNSLLLLGARLVGRNL